MTSAPVRTSASWLALREPADVAARSADLLERVRSSLPCDGVVTVHDLGCGTGSMARWLAPRLRGPQHWVLHDRDVDLLAAAGRGVPRVAGDGSPVTAETRPGDIGRIGTDGLAGATLVTASALLDVMTGEELDRLVAGCAAASCPVLITLSVTGHVRLTPPDPLDRAVQDAFNAHQRRTTGDRTLLGPDAFGVAVSALAGLGLDVLVRASPWRLGPEQAALAAAWFSGWLEAALEQRPELAGPLEAYAERRLTDVAAGRVSVEVAHHDLLARPR